jgi:hypothetical protein
MLAHTSGTRGPNVRVGEAPTRAAISRFPIPSAASSTILARLARPDLTDRDRSQDVNFLRSPSRNTSAGAGRFAMPS